MGSLRGHAKGDGAKDEPDETKISEAQVKLCTRVRPRTSFAENYVCNSDDKSSANRLNGAGSPARRFVMNELRGELRALFRVDSHDML